MVVRLYPSDSEVLVAVPHLAHRALALLYFCSRRLPQVAARPDEGRGCSLLTEAAL